MALVRAVTKACVILVLALTGAPVCRAEGGQFAQSRAADRTASVETGIHYGAHPRQRLDIYRADPASDTGTLVMFLYGGSWSSGDRGIYGFLGSALSARGITTVIPDYRVYPEVRFPEFVDDAARAYAWVAANIGASCGRPRPIIIAGHSAGAHSAALLALDLSYLQRHAAGARAPAGLIGMAGPYAFDPTTWPSTRAIFATARDAPARARPVTFAASAADAPPALLLHGGDDETVKLFNSRDLAAGLNSAGRFVRVIEYPGIGHVGLVLTVSPLLRWRAPVLDDSVDFIRRFALPPCTAALGRPAR